MESLGNKEFEKVLAKNIVPRKVRDSLVDNEYLSDVILVLANGEELRAHKIFLATSGLFFYKLFADHEDDVIRINLEWISKPTMLEVCRFIYADILNINDLTMMDIWSVAIKMQMKYLVEKATDFICKTLNEENVFKVLQTNMKHNDFRLNMKCFEYIQNNYDKNLESDEFLQLPSDLLKTMLQTFKFPNKIAKEAVIKWGNNNSHEDIEELLMSLNEESEAFEKNPKTLFKFEEVQQLKIETIQKPEDEPNLIVSKIPSTTNTDQQSIDHRQNLTKLQNWVTSNQKPNQQLHPMKHFIIDGPKIIKQFETSGLIFEIMSKDMIVMEIHFIGALSSDKVIRIWIHESNSYETISYELIKDVKINGDTFQYIPNKNVLLKPNSSYCIIISFGENQQRQTFDTYYNNVYNDKDRIIFDQQQTLYNHVISSIVYEDA